MDPRLLVRWSGIATIAFGALLATAALLQVALAPERGSGAHFGVGTLQLGALILGVFAATGIYAWHARATGVAALSGYALAVVGLVLTASNTMFFTYLDPWVVEQAPHIPEGIRNGSLAPPAAHVALASVADLALAGGLILLLGAIARKRLLPTGAAIAALVGGLLAVGGSYLHALVGAAGVVLFGAAMIWIGNGMWRDDADAAAVAPLAS